MYYQGATKELLEKAVQLNLPVLLIGETGVGKTAFVRDLAKEKKKELIRLNLTGQTGVDEFVGKILADKAGTYWQDGLLLQAMRRGQWLVLDEINMALPEILSKLHSLLDDDRMVVVSENDGEIVRPHEDFRLFATMNPSDEYAGTKELNRAFLSRFPVVLSIDYTDKEQEILIERHDISSDMAGNLVALAKETRKHKKSGKLSTLISTRDLLYCAQLVKAGVELGQAIKHSMLNKFPDEEAGALNEMVGIITGGKIKVPGIEETFGSISEVIKYAENEVELLKKEKEKFNDLREKISELNEEIADLKAKKVETKTGHTELEHEETPKETVKKKKRVEKGDWVKCISVSSPKEEDVAGHGWKLDQEFQVSKISAVLSSTSNTILWPSGGSGVYERHVKKIDTPKEKLEELEEVPF